MFSAERKKLLKKNAFFRLLDSLTYFAFGLISNYFLLRFLGADYAGLYAALTSITVIFFSFVTGCLQYYGQKIYKPLVDNDDEQLTRQFVSSDRNLKNMAFFSFLVNLIFMFVYASLVETNESITYFAIILYWFIYYVARMVSIATVGKYWMLYIGDEKGWIISLANTIVTVNIIWISFFLLSTGLFWAFLMVFLIRASLLYLFSRFLFYKFGYYKKITTKSTYSSYVYATTKNFFINTNNKLKSFFSKEYNYEKAIYYDEFYIENNFKNSFASITHVIINNALVVIPTILIPIFVTFEYNSFYSYYYIFFTLIGTFVLSTMEGTIKPTVGKMNQENNLNKKVIDHFLNIFLIVASISAIFYITTTPQLVNNIYGPQWTSSINLVNYFIALVLALNILFYFFKRYFMLLSSALGKFKETIKFSYAEITIYSVLIILVPLLLFLLNVDSFYIIISFPIVSSISYLVRGVLEMRYILLKRHSLKMIDYKQESVFFISTLSVVTGAFLILFFTNFMELITVYSSGFNILIILGVGSAIILIPIIIIFLIKKRKSFVSN